jgi:hypothetical protein
MVQPRQDQENAFIENELALQTYRLVPASIYHRLLGHAISTCCLSRSR